MTINPIYKRIAKECFDEQCWEYNKEKSFYNHNWYTCKNGYEVYAESDDDNTTEYYLVIDGNKYGLYFAISFVSQYDELKWDMTDNA